MLEQWGLCERRWGHALDIFQRLKLNTPCEDIETL